MTKFKLLYAVEEVLESNGGFLPMSKSAVYKLIRNGEIPSRKLGKRVFIPGGFIETLIKENREEHEEQENQENCNIGA